MIKRDFKVDFWFFLPTPAIFWEMLYGFTFFFGSLQFASGEEDNTEVKEVVLLSERTNGITNKNHMWALICGKWQVWLTGAYIPHFLQHGPNLISYHGGPSRWTKQNCLMFFFYNDRPRTDVRTDPDPWSARPFILYRPHACLWKISVTVSLSFVCVP